MLNKSIIPDNKILQEYFFKNFALSYGFNSKEESKLIDLVLKKETYEFSSSDEFILKKFEWKSWSFPIFINPPKKLIKNDYLNFDIFVNTFVLLSGIQEINNTNLDRHNRFKYKESLQYKHDFVKTPVINIYFELLYQVAIINGIEITKKNILNPLYLLTILIN